MIKYMCNPYDHSGRLILEYDEDAFAYAPNSPNTREFIFLYDGEEIIGVMHRYRDEDLQPYYFRKNLQGDVTAIYDGSGTKIGEYTYDAYGNCSVTYGMNNDVVRNNPIRYRSYYYDRETKLYYLNARYYDPTLRRFLSLDSTDYLDPETPNGLNLYAYCYNDPVNYADPSGHFAISLTIIGLIAGAVIGATAGGIVAYNVAKDNGAEGWDLFRWTMLGAVGGGVLGGTIGAGLGALATKVTGIVGLSITKYSVIPVRNITVLGNMPMYIEKAKSTGAGYYLIPDHLWNSLSNAERLYNNMQYISDAHSLGSQFVLSPDWVVDSSRTLWQETQYLIRNGIPWSLE